MQALQSLEYKPVATPLLYTVREAAEFARISPSLLRELIAAGTGPRVTRLGRGRGRVLISAAALDEWLDLHTERAA